jgi:hypothetical protein
MLSCIDTETRETDGEEINKVGGNTILNISFLSIQVRETNKPALGNDIAVVPICDGGLAMEVSGAVWDRWVLEGWTSVREGVDEVCITGGEVGRIGGSVVAGPGLAVGVAMILDIYT